MPIYQYYCKECAIAFDMTLHIADRNKPIGADCPACGGEKAIERMLDRPRFIYVRDGAVRTDTDFNSRMKQMKEPLDKAGIENHIQTR